MSNIGQNFAVSIVGAQIPDAEEGIRRILDRLDMFFISAFAAELCINAYANWFKQFGLNVWNWFDVLIVSLSLVGLSQAGISLKFMLLLRSCRVLRIFGKLKAVAKIFSALYCAILPM